MVAFTEQPRVVRNPNERAPLVALVRFRTDVRASTRIEVDDGRRRRVVVYDDAHDPASGLAVIGMRADTEHRIVVTASGGGGATAPVALRYHTPTLPTGTPRMPRLTVVTAEPGEMEPGYTLASIRRAPPMRALWMTPKQRAFMNRWSLLVALDNEGEVVWCYEADSRIAGVHQLRNGNLFFHHVDFRSVEMDMAGTVIREFYASRRPFGPVENAIAIDAQSIHHQPHEMPNGNFLALTANAREIDDYYTSETDPDAPRRRQCVVGDTIVEFAPSGEIVWTWNAFDHLDVYRFGYHLLESYWHTRGFPHHLDWTHGNGVTYDPRDDSVIVSLRHQDALIKIDRASKAIRWILGDHAGWKGAHRTKLLAPAHPLRWHYHGHNPRVTGEGTIVMYDNGIVRAMPFEPPVPPGESFARAVEYEVDEEAMTVREVWTSSDDQDPARVVSWAMGDAHRLERTGNMLVIDSLCLPVREKLNGVVAVEDLTWNEWRRDEWHPSDFPYWARIREMKRDAGREVVFELHIDDPHEIVRWECFGGARVASLYPQGVAAPEGG